MLFFDTGESGELQHSQGLPTQFAQGGGGSSVDQPPGHGSTAGLGVRRGGNAEGAGLGNGFTQQINQGVVNAVVFDASRGEKKFHDASPCRFNRTFIYSKST
jgi:hypothetical protein